MKEKLEIIRTNERMNASELAKKLGVEASAISHIKSGRNKPSFDFVVKILAAFPHINPDWLLLDRGPYSRVDIDAATTTTPELGDNVMDEPLQSVSLFDDVKNIEISGDNSADKNIENSIFPIRQKAGKIVERIIVLYSDKSFDSYNPTSL
jgi:transcriptional regulator with XRE-family HTH domain